MAVARRSVRQSFSDWPNKMRAVSSTDACLSIVIARGEDQVLTTPCSASLAISATETVCWPKPKDKAKPEARNYDFGPLFRVWGFRVSGFQGFRALGLQGCRVLGF